MNLSSIDASEEGYIMGSNTHLPTNNRSTVGGDDDGGLVFDRQSFYSMSGKRRGINKHRRDN